MIEFFFKNLDFFASIRFSHVFGGVIILMLTLFQVYGFMTWRRLKRFGIKVEGTFCGYRGRFNMGHFWRIPVFEFITEEGKHMKASCPFPIVFEKYETGDKVYILYLKC